MILLLGLSIIQQNFICVCNHFFSVLTYADNIFFVEFCIGLKSYRFRHCVVLLPINGRKGFQANLQLDKNKFFSFISDFYQIQ